MGTSRLSVSYSIEKSYSTDVVGLATRFLTPSRCATLDCRGAAGYRTSLTPQSDIRMDRQSEAGARCPDASRPEADYVELSAICPENTEPGVDGMVFWV